MHVHRHSSAEEVQCQVFSLSGNTWYILQISATYFHFSGTRTTRLCCHDGPMCAFPTVDAVARKGHDRFEARASCKDCVFLAYDSSNLLSAIAPNIH